MSNQLIVDWNLKFRFDRIWRQKYKISFGSKEHLEANQIDVWFDIQEDRLFVRLEREYIEQQKDQADLKEKRRFIKERVMDPEMQDKLFEQLRLNLRKGNIGSKQ